MKKAAPIAAAARWFCPKCGRNDFPSFEASEAHQSHCLPLKSGVTFTTFAQIKNQEEAEAREQSLAKLDKLPVAGITGTWAGARHWRDGAVLMEQGKLFCQVMLGFELIALRAALPNESGKRSDLTSSQLGTRWEDLLEKELKLSKSTAYRMMEMAEMAKPRLKKLPELRDFDPATTTFGSLPVEQAEALTTAVKKLTDGATQTSFMQELGLAKSPGAGAGRKPGDGGQGPAKSLTEKADLMRQLAEEDWNALSEMLFVYQEKFTLLDDIAVTAQVAALEEALAARKAWLGTKPEHRDPKVIAALFPA